MALRFEQLFELLVRFGQLRRAHVVTAGLEWIISVDFPPVVLAPLKSVTVNGHRRLVWLVRCPSDSYQEWR